MPRKAALDQALLNLSYTKIYAPANGIVGKRNVQLGLPHRARANPDVRDRDR